MWFALLLFGCLHSKDVVDGETDSQSVPLNPDLGPWSGVIYVERGAYARVRDDGTSSEEEYASWGMGEFRAESSESAYPFGFALGSGEGCHSPAPGVLPERVSVGSSVSVFADNEEAVFVEEIWSDGPEYWAYEGLPTQFDSPGAVVAFEDAPQTTTIPEPLVFKNLDNSLIDWWSSGELSLTWSVSGTSGARVEVTYVGPEGTTSCWWDDEGSATMEIPAPSDGALYDLFISRYHAVGADSESYGRLQLAARYTWLVTPTQ